MGWAAASKIRFWTVCPESFKSFLKNLYKSLLLASGGCPGSFWFGVAGWQGRSFDSVPATCRHSFDARSTYSNFALPQLSHPGEQVVARARL